MVRDDLRFAHAAARVRVLELRLLDRARLERLIGAADVAEALQLLAETEYGQALGALKEHGDYERVLQAELERVYALVKSFSPEPRLLSAWALRHTFHNLKVLLNAALRGQAAEPEALSPLGTLDVGWLAALAAQAVQADGTKGVHAPTAPPTHAQTSEEAGPAEEPFLSRAASAAVAAFRARGTAEAVDQAVDRAYQEYLLALAAVPGAEFLRGWLERWTDLTNLRTSLRYALAGRALAELAAALLPGGTLSAARLLEAYRVGEENARSRLDALAALAAPTPYGQVVAEGLRRWESEGLLHGFEQLMDLHLLDYLRLAKREPTGFAPVWAYLMAKEQEVRLLRLILVGKSAGLPREQIRERVSDVYA